MSHHPGSLDDGKTSSVRLSEGQRRDVSLSDQKRGQRSANDEWAKDTGRLSGSGVHKQGPREQVHVIEKAQEGLLSRADAMSQHARQFQAFLMGGESQTPRRHWTNVRGSSDLTRQLLRANVSLRFRG
ncbi:MAG TPA: hypothetical protein DCE42_01200 [Myxococcales bacterium]|nr:hypothetical protein [Deltaproteobacteria bacterium]HAA53338.1 hypothetical protein [Myxococcales bacterium]